MRNLKKIISLLILFNSLIPFAYTQTGFCSGGQLQSPVSGLDGNNVATYMSSIQYQPSFNRFLVAIYNNNQILTQTECANFPGQSVPNPGVTNFQVLLSCNAASNGDGNGLVGGIQLPSNNSVITTTSSVNVAQGQTYFNIPVVPLNPQQNLAGRICTLTLQATLFCIQGDGNCFPSYNEPITSYTYSTGPSGHSSSCTFGDLTCYADRDILWQSTLLWIIIDSCFIAITCFFIVPNLYWYLRIKKMDNLRIKALNALNKKNAISYDQYINLNAKQQQTSYKNKKKPKIYPPSEEEEIEEPTTILSSQFFSASASGKKTQKQTPPNQLFIKDEKTGESIGYQKVTTNMTGPSSSSSSSSISKKQTTKNRLTDRNSSKSTQKPLDISFNFNK